MKPNNNFDFDVEELVLSDKSMKRGFETTQ